MTNKKLGKLLETELLDALSPEYSEYMFHKAKEWANIDGDITIHDIHHVDYESMEWGDYFWNEEFDWEEYNLNHNGRYKINEAA